MSTAAGPLRRPRSGPTLRVLLATRIYAPEPAAASFRLEGLVRALAAAGARVDVLTTRTAGAPSETPARVRVRRWPVLRDSSGYVRGYFQYLSFDVPLILRLLTTRRVDVMVCEPPPTTGAMVRIAAALRRVPYVYYAADIWSDAAAATSAPRVISGLLRVVERWAMRGAAGVIGVSDAVAVRLGELGVSRVSVVRNGVDTDVYTDVGESPPGRPYVVYAGTLSEWQGADIFARAMEHVSEEVPGARLVYIGQGSAWPEVERVARRLRPGVVTMLPTMPPGEVAGWLRGAAVALVSIRPDAGYEMAYPTKVLAALACGTPVVFAGNGPAADDVRDHGLGRSVDYDVDAVASVIVDALTTRSLSSGGNLRSWVLETASLRASSQRAAEVVLAVSSVTGAGENASIQ